MNSHHEGLPDGCEAVVRSRFAPGCYMADEFPGASSISTSININLGPTQVLRNAVARKDDRARWKLPKRLAKLEEMWLVPQPPVVDRVLHLGNLNPRLAVVVTLVDRKIDARWLR